MSQKINNSINDVTSNYNNNVNHEVDPNINMKNTLNKIEKEIQIIP